jgi:hypothetical protein
MEEKTERKDRMEDGWWKQARREARRRRERCRCDAEDQDADTAKYGDSTEYNDNPLSPLISIQSTPRKTSTTYPRQQQWQRRYVADGQQQHCSSTPDRSRSRTGAREHHHYRAQNSTSIPAPQAKRRKSRRRTKRTASDTRVRSRAPP